MPKLLVERDGVNCRRVFECTALRAQSATFLEGMVVGRGCGRKTLPKTNSCSARRRADISLAVIPILF